MSDFRLIRKHDADDVEPDLRNGYVRFPKVSRGSSGEQRALSAVYRLFRKSEIDGGPCLHLNHRQRWTIPGDEVQFTRPIFGSPISRDYDISQLLEEAM